MSRLLQTVGAGRRLIACLLAVGAVGAVASAQTTIPHARPRLLGFSPLVAITTSDAGTNEELDWSHVLETGYTGNAMAGNAATNYTIGVLDTGASIDLIGAGSVEQLGVVGDRLTSNTTTITGASGELEVPISQPMGVYAQGLSAIGDDGKLDLEQLYGHSNVSTVALPADSEGTDQLIPTVLGIPMLAFYTSVIRNDTPRTVTYQGEQVTSPDVQIYPVDDPNIPDFQHQIPMTMAGLGGLPITTASYSALDLTGGTDFRTPNIPTLLTAIEGTFPTGGAPFASLIVGQGELSPTNPVQQLTMLVDTGAQTSIISPTTAANLNLDLRNPDFTQDVLGIGGITEDVPGFFVDYVKMNASGGALEFSHAPFLVLDLQSPAGGPLDGVLGMNLFWNRNVKFAPSLTGSGFLEVSEPLFGPEVLLGDVNLNLKLDAADIDDLFAKRGGPLEEADPAVYDLDGDNLVNQADADYLISTVLNTAAGDANLDGKVDLTDFGVLKDGFGRDGGWAAGDFDGNGKVDLADFGALKENFGFVRPASAAVPEPSTLCLTLLALALGAAAKRRTR